MVWIFIIAGASIVSVIGVLSFPPDIALPVNVVALVLMFTGIYRYYSVYRRLAAFTQRVVHTPDTHQNDIVGALESKFADHAKTLAQVVTALDRLAENADDTATIEVEGAVGDALRSFRDKLAELKKHEQRQQWASKGMVALNGIKKNANSLEQYAYDAVSTLVKYVNANQGSFYLLHSDNEHLRLFATYAYNRRWYTDGDVLVHRDNGLVGQCIQERDIICITQIPKGYVKITSGLGEAEPRALIIIPLMYRDQIYGAIEIASFQVLEPYQVDFCRTFCEEIAAEISGLQIQQQTSSLLEQAQLQAEQLKAQEEVMRQNMEEMAATQEEMARQQTMLREKIAEIDGERAKHQAILETCVDAVLSFTEDGTIHFANKAAKEMFGYTDREMKDQSIYSLFDFQIVSTASGDVQLITKTGNAITSRTEVNAVDKDGSSLSLLLTVAQVNLKEKSLFTLFAQKISVDLF